MTQQVKDPTLSLQQLGSLPWCSSIPSPGTSTCHMPRVRLWLKKKNQKTKKECLGKNLLGSGWDVGGPELLLVLVN